MLATIGINIARATTFSIVASKIPIAAAAKIAVRMGSQYCPDGYRLITNVGSQAMQSQSHGHIHVIGGTRLGMYVYGPVPFA